MTRKPAPARRRSKTHNLAYAVLFFVLGVIGILIPIVPQIPFFIMSALFLSFAFPRVRRALRRFRHRHPKLEEAYRRWRHSRIRKRLLRIRRHRPGSPQ